MSGVNHSYEDLGILLKEKISELESMLSKMQNIQEESTSMMQWLQKMDKTASDWEAAPTDSEAVKAQVEQHKVFCAFKKNFLQLLGKFCLNNWYLSLAYCCREYLNDPSKHASQT